MKYINLIFYEQFKVKKICSKNLGIESQNLWAPVFFSEFKF